MLFVKCALHELWQNCPRYIYRYKRVAQSRYTSDNMGNFPLAEWKRIDLLEDVLPRNDKEKVKSFEKININDWLAKVKSGASDV